jgi:hypothetical protein
MRLGLVVLSAALLLQTAAMAQTSPKLQISNSNEVASISWSNGSANFYSLQTTANPFFHPVIWADQQFGVSGAGTQNITNLGSQAFFRLAPLTPLFQYAIFYNVNMEIDPGAAMTITGPVFCNQNIWEGSAVCTFASTVRLSDICERPANVSCASARARRLQRQKHQQRFDSLAPNA